MKSSNEEALQKEIDDFKEEIRRLESALEDRDAFIAQMREEFDKIATLARRLS